MTRDDFRSLPLAGKQLVKLRFFGNGKDSEVTIETSGNREMVIPLDYARVNLTLSGPINIACESWDDLSIVWEIVPGPDQRIDIAEAAFDFSGDDEEWEETLRSYEDTGRFDGLGALRLELVSTRRENVQAG